MRKITLGELRINDKGKKYIQAVLDSNRLSRGPFTQKFEQEFAGLHGCAYGIFCNSGTSALQIALAALKEDGGWQDGDEVLVPSTTFIATSNVVLQNNLKPVFVEVDPHSFNMDPADIEHRITGRTRAIIPVHLFGLSCDMLSIMRVAEKHNLRVLEDSCETVCASQDGKSVGSFGDLAAFSTYVNHLIVGGVGGLVTTNNAHLAELCLSYMQHGRDSIYTNINDDDGLSGASLKNIIERRFKFERVGYSYRATELEAAIALSELERWEDNISRRRENAALLISLLGDLQEHIQLPVVPPNFTHSFMMFPFVVKGPDRDKFLLFLEEGGVETRFLFPLLSQPIYQRLFPQLDDSYRVSQKLARNGAMIGIHQGLSQLDISYVSDIFHEFVWDTKCTSRS